MKNNLLNIQCRHYKNKSLHPSRMNAKTIIYITLHNFQKNVTI